MNCIKCGRETPSEQVFCEDCLLDMEKHPVKPGTVVLLPKRKETAAPKKTSKRRVLPLEDQVKVLRKRVRLLAVLLLIFICLSAALAKPAIDHMTEDHFKKGQNYHTVTVPTESTSAEN